MSALERYDPDDDRTDIEREHDKAIELELARHPIRIPPEVKEVYDSDDKTFYLTVGGIAGIIATAAVVKKITRKD